MSVLIINTLRYLLTFVLTSGVWHVAASFLETVVDNARGALQRDGLLSHQEVDDTMLNFTLDTLALIGVSAAAAKTRLPLRLADKLGLKSATATKKNLSATTIQKTQVAAQKGVLAQKATQAAIIGGAASLGGALFWLPTLLQGIGDQATFQPKNANNYWESIFGFRPFKESSASDSPGPFTPAEFDDYARSLESVGITAINHPGKNATLRYTRLALADLIDYVYGLANTRGQATTVTKLKPMLAPYLVGLRGPAPAGGTLSPVGAGPGTYTPVKIFTGIVSQGTLGASQPFSSREDDLINSADELRDIAQTNAAAFIASLPGRIQYEIRIVNSVITADGSRRTGQIQRIQTGTLKSGEPRYKYVNNRFAILSLYYSRREGTRTKIADITLGPTDVARFNPSAHDLANTGNALRSLVSTSNIADITNIVSSSPLAVSNPDSTSPDVTGSPVPFAHTDPNDTGYRYYFINVNGDDLVQVLPWTGNVPHGHVPTDKKTAIARLQSLSSNPKYAGSAAISSLLVDISQGKYDGPSGYIIENDTPKRYDTSARALAKTLSEFYAAMSLPLPSVSERGQIYQSLGLGAASLYTGTVEQNTKLLLKLQGKS